MDLPIEKECLALHHGRWRTGRSDGKYFWFNDGHWGVDSRVEIGAINEWRQIRTGSPHLADCDARESD